MPRNIPRQGTFLHSVCYVTDIKSYWRKNRHSLNIETKLFSWKLGLLTRKLVKHKQYDIFNINNRLMLSNYETFQVKNELKD